MGMNLNTGNQGDVHPVMNVTPLVDVVLVLLIIFMVVTPLLTKKLWVHIPKQEKKEIEETQPDLNPEPPLVLRVMADKTVNVNGVVIPFDELPGRLRRMFAAREDHILFFDAEDAAPYGFAVQVMDQARAGGAVTIATLIQALGADTVTPPAPADAATPVP